MQALRLCTRVYRAPPSSLLFTRFYSSNSTPNGTNGTNGNNTTTNGINGNNNNNENKGSIGIGLNAEDLVSESEKRKIAKKGTIHDEEYISGSPTNTRNYGKIKVENEVSRVLDAVLPKAPKFDDEDQTGMDYQARMDAKLKKIETLYPPDSEEREQALLAAHNQLEEEIKTELIREFEFDPVEHKKTQKYTNLTYVSTTAYSIPGMEDKKGDNPPREDTSGGFVFGSLNFASSAESENDSESDREYVKGHHGQNLKIPKKKDIYVVDRPLDPKN